MIGCIGIGQTGTNFAEHFAEYFPTIAIDTAKQNLNNCKNIQLIYHAKINEMGGAGKNIKLGEKAILQHQDKIQKMIQLNLQETDFVIITSSLGGGTGTLGTTQISKVLSNMGIPHGMLVTLPADYEGIDEKINARVGLYAIQQALETFDNLRSIIIVENEKLKTITLDKYDISFENVWEKANKYVFDIFYNILKFTQQSSSFTIDGQDFLKILMKKGYMAFMNCYIEDVENKPDTILATKVQEEYENNIFVKRIDFNTAKGLGMIINRPEKYNDGKAIERLFREMNKFIGSGTLATGIYTGKESILSNIINKKGLEIFSVISGMEFPIKRYKELQEITDKELDKYQKKGKNTHFEFDIEKISSYLNEGVYKKEKKEFRVFKDNCVDLKPVNWNKIKTVNK